jgi:hypothetical protein
VTEHLTPDQRQQLHNLALGLLAADADLQAGRDQADATKVRKAERTRDALRKQAGLWIVQLDQLVNAPVEA